jgi:hypothetical protein
MNIRSTNPVAGRVPGLLIVSQIPGRRPLILYGHWMLQGSPLRNKGEFLDEAVVMARSGAICLLLDTPPAREGVTEDPAPMHGQGPNAILQMSKEWRRALDLLLTRQDVDSRRIAYVGHSFSAAVGAKLTGVEKRISSFVLMANQYSLREYIDDDQNADMVALRKKMGEDWINAYFARFPWTTLFLSSSIPHLQRSSYRTAERISRSLSGLSR